jgi:hypothetical protein
MQRGKAMLANGENGARPCRRRVVNAVITQQLPWADPALHAVSPSRTVAFVLQFL